MFKGTIEAIIMDQNADNVVKTATETIVPAKDRHGAICVILDMGQAMARSANAIRGRSLYFRVLGVTKVEDRAE